MNYEVLNEENFLMYAIKCYDNPGCTGLTEFQEDLNHIVYLKRLFNRYLNTGELKSHLIYSHMTLLCNVFGKNVARILFYKMEEKYWPLIKPYLIQKFLLPDLIEGINEKTIRTVEIPMDQELFNPLREIQNVDS